MKPMMSLPLLAAAMMVAPAAVPGAHAQDAKAGRAKAATQCAVCHGPNGIAQLPEAPNLAGQVEIYVAKALEEFRTGKRTNEMMTVVSQELSDADIANLAAWYASIEISVQLPP